MKLALFENQGPHIGAVFGDLILDINSARPFMPQSIEEVLRRGLLPELQNLVDNASEIDRSHLKSLKEVSLYPPLRAPSKIICLGLNYRGHAREQKKEAPDHPLLFAKAPSALTGPYDDIVIRPSAEDVDAEAELAVVIGREGTMIHSADAVNYIAGYMAMNDVSARKCQKEDKQWFRAKSFNTFAPCGPWIVTSNEIPDPHNLSIKQKLNDAVMQDSNTSEMIFDVTEIISYVSSAMTLLPGDIIATGTPEGVGVFRNPPLYLKDGDVVTIEIERIGLLRNRVTALK
jgi:2-keto-4-pentenoate hydratase/2-oxohepta-3-ene-1,7-dioic acid hydratase in catechol pathway